MLDTTDLRHLILARQVDEEIVYVIPPRDVPTTFRVKVERIRGDTVRLGSMVPKSVTVDRLEVYEAKLAGIPMKILGTKNVGVPLVAKIDASAGRKE